jgi:hypothetical protein
VVTRRSGSVVEGVCKSMADVFEEESDLEGESDLERDVSDDNSQDPNVFCISGPQVDVDKVLDGIAAFTGRKVLFSFVRKDVPRLPEVLMRIGSNLNIVEVEHSFPRGFAQWNEEEANILYLSLVASGVVKVLRLFDCHFSDLTSFVLLAERVPSLEMLTLIRCNLSQEVVRQDTCRRLLDSNLTVLELSCNPLMDQGVGVIARIMKQRTKLKCLDLTMTGMVLHYGDPLQKGWIDLMEMLKINKSLEEL